MNATSSHDRYENPLICPLSPEPMACLWGDQRKFSTWRRLWVATSAEAEREMGLAITDQQISELRAHIDDIDFDAANKYERKLRHDVMAHVHTYGDVCPNARPIIHLGATSCYVTDNTDLLLMRRGCVRSVTGFVRGDRAAGCCQTVSRTYHCLGLRICNRPSRQRLVNALFMGV